MVSAFWPDAKPAARQQSVMTVMINTSIELDEGYVNDGTGAMAADNHVPGLTHAWH